MLVENVASRRPKLEFLRHLQKKNKQLWCCIKKSDVEKFIETTAKKKGTRISELICARKKQMFVSYVVKKTVLIMYLDELSVVSSNHDNNTVIKVNQVVCKFGTVLIMFNYKFLWLFEKIIP